MSAVASIGSSLGLMVRGASELFVYWRGSVDTLRVYDLTGRPEGGMQEFAVTGKWHLVTDLAPGRLYGVVLGHGGGGRFQPVHRAGPVQLPWRPQADTAPFPHPYARS